MENGNQPAYPVPHIIDGNWQKNPQTEYCGLTKREYFAAMAPEVPVWFEHKKSPYPKEPKSWVDMGKDDPFREEAKQWFQDPCYDIKSDELQWFQEAWEKFWKERDIWNKQDKASRYFQWHCYYADALLAELDKPLTNL